MLYYYYFRGAGNNNKKLIFIFIMNPKEGEGYKMPVGELVEQMYKQQKHTDKAYEAGREAGCSNYCIGSIFLGFLGILLLLLLVI